MSNVQRGSATTQTAGVVIPANSLTIGSLSTPQAATRPHTNVFILSWMQLITGAGTAGIRHNITQLNNGATVVIGNINIETGFGAAQTKGSVNMQVQVLENAETLAYENTVTPPGSSGAGSINQSGILVFMF